MLQVMRIDLKMDKEIGKGSFGKVSIARWRGLTVAVKELKGNSEIGFHTTTPEILKNLQKVQSYDRSNTILIWICLAICTVLLRASHVSMRWARPSIEFTGVISTMGCFFLILHCQNTS